MKHIIVSLLFIITCFFVPSASYSKDGGDHLRAETFLLLSADHQSLFLLGFVRGVILMYDVSQESEMHRDAADFFGKTIQECLGREKSSRDLQALVKKYVEDHPEYRNGEAESLFIEAFS